MKENEIKPNRPATTIRRENPSTMFALADLVRVYFINKRGRRPGKGVPRRHLKVHKPVRFPIRNASINFGPTKHNRL